MIEITDPEALEARLAALYTRLRPNIDACELCAGTGRIVLETVWEDGVVPLARTEVCACKRAVLFDVALREAGLPREFWRADEIEPEHNADHYALIRLFGAELGGRVREHGLSLLLSGENGTGKTSGAAIAVIAAIRAGLSAAVISWPDLVNVLRSTRFDAKVARRLQGRLRRDLVVIDEIGKESRLNATDDFAQQQLDSAVRARRGDRLPTILITNLGVADFTRRYGTSVASLITPPYRVLEYEPGDYRAHAHDAWDSL